MKHTLIRLSHVDYSIILELNMLPKLIFSQRTNLDMGTRNVAAWSTRIGIGVMFFTCMLPACSTRVMTAEEVSKVSSKTYPSVPPQTILLAVSDLFFLADDKVFHRSVNPSQIVATRTHSLDLGFKLAQAKDTWKVTTQHVEEGTKVTLDIKSEESWLTGKPRVQTPNGPAAYTQFWNRLDYLLGESSNWMSCRDLENEYLEDRTWGDVWWLCSELQDRLPPELATGIWQKGRDTELSPEDQQQCLAQVSSGVYGETESKRQRDIYFSVCLEEQGYRLVEERSEPTEP